MIGLFGTTKFDCHPWSLAAGAITSTIYIFGIYFGHLRDCTDCGSINAGITGILVQLLVLVSAESGRRVLFPEQEIKPEEQARSESLIFPNRPLWDIPKRARFGERPLTPKLLWKMMDGNNEPLANPWYGFLMFVTISMVTPFVAPNLPTDTADLDDVVVHGLPWWVVKMFAFAALPTIILLVVFIRMPNQYSRPEWKGDKDSTMRGMTSTEATDPDLLEMTPEELGHRTSYDDRNELVYRRRMEILQKLGVSPAEIDNIVKSKLRAKRVGATDKPRETDALNEPDIHVGPDDPDTKVYREISVLSPGEVEC